MLRNNLNIGYRNFIKQKGYSFITVFGLALGIACCLLMYNYVQFETSFDNFHPNGNRTYRVDQLMPFRASDAITSSTAPPLAYTLKSIYPEVEETMRINTRVTLPFVIRTRPDPSSPFRKIKFLLPTPRSSISLASR